MTTRYLIVYTDAKGKEKQFLDPSTSESRELHTYSELIPEFQELRNRIPIGSAPENKPALKQPQNVTTLKADSDILHISSLPHENVADQVIKVGSTYLRIPEEQTSAGVAKKNLRPGNTKTNPVGNRLQQCHEKRVSQAFGVAQSTKCVIGVNTGGGTSILAVFFSEYDKT